MRLYEFHSNTSRQPENVASVLSRSLNLERVGGDRRVYTVGKSKAAIYVIGNTTRAIAIAWEPELGVTAIYVWLKFNIFKSPNYVLQLPMDQNFQDMAHTVVEWIKSPTTGKIAEDGEQIEEEILDEARRTTAAEFMGMAQRMFGDKASKLSIVDLNKIAQENDVQIPSEIRQSREYKVDAHNWNLSGKSSSDNGETNNELSKAVGAPVEDEPETLDPAYHDALRLAKAKTVSRMASQGKVYLMGRKTNGAFFRIQGFDEYAAQMERLLSREITKAGGDTRASMEQQYEDMKDKVKLVAGGGTNFLKSLLITGAPSSGKTYTVMQTIKALGLVEGRDYVVKKGRITALSMYRTLIEQIEGMVIFDDCDSVVEDKNGVNMLKGALDTDPVRELSYDVRGTLNTSVMDPQQRDITVDAISRILRGKPESTDLSMFDRFLKKKKKEKDRDEDEIEDDEDDLSRYDTEDFDDEEDASFDYEKLHELQQYFTKHLPNKIDFRGRIIFISNMPESDWDSAILTRAFTINMDFTSQEMLDYIDKIKSHIKTPGLSDEQKQEVMDYVRDLYTTGKLKRPINFRLIQQCFDLRLVDSWKRLIAML